MLLHFHFAIFSIILQINSKHLCLTEHVLISSWKVFSCQAKVNEHFGQKQPNMAQLDY